MSNIARQTGIAKGTLYNYFANKEDLLTSACECFAQPLLNEIRALLDTDISARDILVAMLHAKIKAFRQYYRVIEAFLTQFGKNSIVEEYEEGSFRAQINELLNLIFAKAESAGVKLPFSVDKMAEIYDGATTGLIRCMKLNKGADLDSFPTDEEVKNFVDMFLPNPEK